MKNPLLWSVIGLFIAFFTMLAVNDWNFADAVFNPLVASLTLIVLAVFASQFRKKEQEPDDVARSL